MKKSKVDIEYDEYFMKNIDKWEEWSWRKYDKVIYNSYIDECESFSCRHKIYRHNHFYFILIDLNNNIFGHYHHGTIDKCMWS